MKIEKMYNAITELNGKIIAFTPERNNDYMYIVFVKRQNEYVIWNYNSNSNGMYTGYYTPDYGIAYTEFMRRIENQ